LVAPKAGALIVEPKPPLPNVAGAVPAAKPPPLLAPKGAGLPNPAPGKYVTPLVPPPPRVCTGARTDKEKLLQTLLWWLPVQDETGCGFRGRGGGTEGSRTEGSSSEAPRCRGSGASTKSSTPER
jgi:hypothetical protein